MNNNPDLTEFDQPSRALNLLSVVCPPLGLIIYLSLVGKLPRQAISAGRSAIHSAIGMLIFYASCWILVYANLWMHSGEQPVAGPDASLNPLAVRIRPMPPAPSSDHRPPTTDH